MTSSSATTRARRERLAQICGALPEASGGSRTGQHDKYEVRGKTFAYYLNDHYGDPRTALVCKVPAGMQAPLIASDPQRFYMPAYLGAKGWLALRIDGRVDWGEVEELVRESYRLIAPKRLAAMA